MARKHKQHKTLIRRIKTYGRYLRKSLASPKSISALAVMVIVFSFILIKVNDNKNIYTADLLATIAKVESNDNYNAYFGNAGNSQILFTSMPIKDVLAWQDDFVAKGNASSAVGRYQFVDSTLRGLVTQLKIDQNTIFDKPLQDKLAVALLERRGLREYVDTKLSREEFAHNLSKEWAALPKAIGDNPQQSYYAGDGLNHARLSINEIFSSIDTLRKID